jgi:hypothetical protein
MDLSVLSNVAGSERELTKEKLFKELWDRIVDQLEWST